jgi:acyl-CoA dehydrogenase
VLICPIAVMCLGSIDRALALTLADECLQFFGGYGYMTEYPIPKIFLDSRVLKIYGGTSEIMMELISRSL